MPTPSELLSVRPTLESILFRHRGVLVVLALSTAAILPARDRGLLQLGLAALLVLVGFGARIAGIRRIGSRAKVYTAGARELLTDGIFGYVRNPLYLGNSLVAAGACVLLRSAECAPLVVLALLGVYTVIARHEERSLRELFGAPYDQYRAEVRRWWPRLSPYRTGTPTEPVVWSEVMRSERGFVAGCAALLLATLLAALHFGPLVELREFVAVEPVPALLTVLALAVVLVLKIEVYRPLKRSLKRSRAAR